VRRASRIGAERQLVLVSASTAIRREALHEHARALSAAVEWSSLGTFLRHSRLLATLGPRIIELAGERSSTGFACAVDEALLAARRQGSALALLTAGVSAELAQAGIRSRPLKGAALSETLYGDVGRRVSKDVDLLVRPQQLHAAVQIVRGIGYRAPADPTEANGLPRLHFALEHERAELPPIELHWRIHWYETTFASERLLPPAAPGVPAPWRAAPVDELAALLLFYARDGFAGLRIAADIAAWWDRYGSTLPAGAFNHLLGIHPSLAPVLRASLGAAEMVVGLPTARILGETHELSLRGRAAVRLANPSPGSGPSQLYAEMGLIDGLLTPPGGLREFLTRQLLLPREVLDQRAHRDSERRTRSWLAYGARLAVRCGVLFRYALALARIAREPETLATSDHP
jgi:hypothetical protein